MDKETYGFSPDADALLSEELMIQEELRLMQQGEISGDWDSSGPPSEAPTEISTDLIEPIGDDEDMGDVVVESKTIKPRLSLLIADPKIKWAVIAVLALFAIWLITSGVLWSIIKFIFKLVVGVIGFLAALYVISKFISSDDT